ncbi:bifunctional pyr operon transcriptional regulator/uracil phosphoribosyltransferase PyrR [Adhaeribacter terreus]|uniref:Bifunctional pyr operon transcriptional regulator/uracil phosphoribosyltransferase PyrR n=1 Tax=Adhaeribacter terreus TaxID=529703 RepID=A0ABW0EAX4_9BACT
MQKRLIVPHALLQIMLQRLCHQLIETHGDFSKTVLIGLQPRGKFLAQRIQKQLQQITGSLVPLGFLDTTFYRDDFRRRENPIAANATSIDFIIEDRRVVLIDDVLFTGRSVRAALDAMIAFGRPAEVELLILIDRLYQRDLPIQANYVGQKVNSLASQKVLVAWQNENTAEDNIWLISKTDEV